MKERDAVLLRRIRVLTWIFIFALIVAGLTAIPLEWELDFAAKLFGVSEVSSSDASSSFLQWILKVREALHETNLKYPFVAYGTDWLAFGHVAIAVAFFGALKNPVRNIWIFQFGMIACALIVPWAFFFGGLRGIPIYWRLIDCSFGIFGIIPLFLCRKYTQELERLRLDSISGRL